MFRRSPFLSATGLGLFLLLVRVVPSTAMPAQYPLQPGEAAASCFSGFVVYNNPSSGIDPTQFVLAVADVRDPKADNAVPGANWLARMFHNEFDPQGNPRPANHPDIWNARNLGQVFGVTLDDANPPNLYVSATTAYGLFKNGNNFQPGMFGPGGPGAVYRIDGATGHITTFTQLPNTGPALGDVAYDRLHHQFFVTNFDNGLIYRVAAAGNILLPGQIINTFDHGVVNLGIPDTSGPMNPAYSSANPTHSSGFTALGRRPWAVQVFQGRLYYSVWANDQRADSNSAPNEIWSVALDPVTGDFMAGTSVKEISLTKPIKKPSGALFSSPVSDIAFAADGRMLIAERTMSNGDVGPLNVTASSGHRSRVLEFTGGTGNWSYKVFHVSAVQDIQLYDPPASTSPADRIHSNTEGGVDYGYEAFTYQAGTPSTRRSCETTVWATAEQILGPFATKVYGLTGIKGSGNTYATAGVADYAIDLNGILNVFDKSRIGDVEVYRPTCLEDCFKIEKLTALCVPDHSGDVTLSFSFVNQTPDQIYHLFISDLVGGVTATPDHADFSANPVAPGATGTVSGIKLHNVPIGGGPITFTISIHNQNLEMCCSLPVTITLPECDCGQTLEESPVLCVQPSSGPPVFQYSFKWQHLNAIPAAKLIVVASSPANVTSTPGLITLNPVLSYGGVSPLQTVTISGPGAQFNQQVCLLLSAHDTKFRKCCSIEKCFTLPDGDFCFFIPRK